MAKKKTEYTPAQTAELQKELELLQRKTDLIKKKLGVIALEASDPARYIGTKVYGVVYGSNRTYVKEIEIDKKLLARNKKAKGVHVRDEDDGLGLRITLVRVSLNKNKPRDTTYIDVYPTIQQALQFNIEYHKEELIPLETRYQDAKDELEVAKEEFDDAKYELEVAKEEFDDRKDTVLTLERMLLAAVGTE